MKKQAMKKNFRGAIAPILVLAGAVLPVAAAEAVTLKVADTFPPGHYIVKNGTKYWMDRVTELTNGEVKFEYFGAGQLGSLRDMFSLVQNGVVDVGYVPPAFNSGTTPLATVHTLPALFSKSAVGTPAFFDTVSEGPILEHDFLANGMRPLWGVMTSTYNVFTRGVEVGGLDDIKGLKLKSIAGNMSESVKALGGAPVDIPSPETYQAIRTGTVDGAVFPTTSVYSYRLDEVVDTGLMGLDLFVFWAPYMINEKTWQRLSPEIRTAIEQASRETMQRTAAFTDNQAAELEDKMRADGIKIVRLSSEEKEKVRKVTSPVSEAWVADMEARGLPGAQILETFKSNIEKYQAVVKKRSTHVRK